MLSKEHNELITRVGPGTPMGETLRQFWMPAVRSAKLEVDGAPVRFRLLGQDFVAFRDTNGRVGILDEACPHRGVSLALGRNEECGLRCIFHGWKFNVDGEVVEVPSEPKGSNLASKVRVGYYLTHEAAGVVWVYLGKDKTPPQFPAFDVTNYPLENVVARKATVPCNWVTLVEGVLDSSHVTSLHKDWLPTGKDAMTGPNAGIMNSLVAVYEIEDRPYGYVANARRTSADGTQVNRKTEFILPFFAMVPTTLKTFRGMVALVPIDDENTEHWAWSWDQAGPLTPELVNSRLNSGEVGDDLDNYYAPHYHHGPDQLWGQDREAMKRGESYAGLGGISFEDFAVSRSQGIIPDRSQEHLGTSDVAIIRMRRILIDLVRTYERGEKPRILQGEIDYGKIQPVHEIFSANGEPVVINA